MCSSDLSNRKALIQFKIFPIIEKVSLRYNGKVCPLNLVSNIWQIKLEDVKVGRLSIELLIDNMKPVLFEIDITGGLKDIKLF